MKGNAARQPMLTKCPEESRSIFLHFWQYGYPEIAFGNPKQSDLRIYIISPQRIGITDLGAVIGG